MYNYGSPRVGNRTFAREFNRLVPNAWRVVNGNDAVVTVPRLLGYCHVGHAVRVSVTGEVDIQSEPQRQACWSSWGRLWPACKQ